MSFDPWDLVRQLVARVKTNLDDITNVTAVMKSDPAEEAERKELARIGREVTRVFRHLEAVQRIQVQAVVELSKIDGHPDLNESAKDRERHRIRDGHAALVAEELDGAAKTWEALASRLRGSLLPARPQPENELQEVRLQSLKADLRMVLDTVAPSGLDDAMVEELRLAVDRGDDLAVWLLVASEWPERYHRSRGSGSFPTYQQRAGGVLDGHSESRELPRELLRRLDRPDGLSGAITAVRHMATQQMRDLAA